MGVHKSEDKLGTCGRHLVMSQKYSAPQNTHFYCLNISERELCQFPKADLYLGHPIVYHLFLQIPFWSVYQPQDPCYPRIPSSSLQTDSKEIIHQDKKYFPQFDIFNDYQMFEITTSSTIYIKLKIYKIGLSKLVFCEFLTNFCKYVEETVLIQKLTCLNSFKLGSTTKRNKNSN